MGLAQSNPIFQKIFALFNIFHRSIKIQLTPSDLLPFRFQQSFNSTQLVVLSTLFQSSKIVCNQMSVMHRIEIKFYESLRNNLYF